MFYNVRTRQIEDWTGKGFEDLKNKVARTPQEPL
jgi:tRNA nucleotidyltransferase/poly(A) polymerase